MQPTRDQPCSQKITQYECEVCYMWLFNNGLTYLFFEGFFGFLFACLFLPNGQNDPICWFFFVVLFTKTRQLQPDTGSCHEKNNQWAWSVAEGKETPSPAHVTWCLWSVDVLKANFALIKAGEYFLTKISILGAPTVVFLSLCYNFHHFLSCVMLGYKNISKTSPPLKQGSRD